MSVRVSINISKIMYTPIKVGIRTTVHGNKCQLSNPMVSNRILSPNTRILKVTSATKL